MKETNRQPVTLEEVGASPIGPAICKDCGGDYKVRWQTDPFAEEIRGDMEKRWLCDTCAHESAMDI